jgi:hypothetical protein
MWESHVLAELIEMVQYKVKPAENKFNPKKSRRYSVPTLPVSCSASSLLHFLSTCFKTFPLAVFGNSSFVPSSLVNQTHAGAF